MYNMYIYLDVQGNVLFSHPTLATATVSLPRACTDCACLPAEGDEGPVFVAMIIICSSWKVYPEVLQWFTICHVSDF